MDPLNLECDKDPDFLRLRLALECLLDRDCPAACDRDDAHVVSPAEAAPILVTAVASADPSAELPCENGHAKLSNRLGEAQRRAIHCLLSKDVVAALRNLLSLLSDLEEAQLRAIEKTAASARESEQRPTLSETRSNESELRTPYRRALAPLEEASRKALMDFSDCRYSPCEPEDELQYVEGDNITTTDFCDTVSPTDSPAAQISTEMAIRLSIMERERDGALAALAEALNLVADTEAKMRDGTARIAELQQENALLKSDLACMQENLHDTGLRAEQEVMSLKIELSSQYHACSTAEEGYKLQQAEMMHLSELLSNQERTIELLHAELQELAEERSFERELQLRQVQQLQSDIEDKIAEGEALADQLEKVNEELHNKAKELVELEQSKRAVKRQYNHLVAVNEGDIRQLREDNVELKKRLVKLLKDKDNLWLKADMLAYRQREQAEIKWMPDDEVSTCLNCGTRFTFTTRKHHCRLCGRIFCARCVNNWIMTVSSSKKVRICNQCFIERNDAAALLSTPASTADVESEDQEHEPSPAATSATAEPVSIVGSMKRWLRNGLSASTSAVFDSRARSSVDDGTRPRLLSRSSSIPVLPQIASSPLAQTSQASSSCLEDSYDEITDFEVAEFLTSGAESNCSKCNDLKGLDL